MNVIDKVQIRLLNDYAEEKRQNRLFKTITCKQCGVKFKGDKRRQFCNDCIVIRNKEHKKLAIERNAERLRSVR